MTTNEAIDMVCGEIRNYFADYSDRVGGEYTIEGGSIAGLELANGQWFRIVGSVFNDGVYQYPASELVDETFTGAVWAMKVPPVFLSLVEEIKTFLDSDEAKVTPYTSESFAGYSYTKATGASGAAVGWADHFAGKLNRWRRLIV